MGESTMPRLKDRKTNNRHASELVDTLVSVCSDPARLLELYYWSTEPELLPIIRGFASLPSETRVMLERFLLVDDPKSVIADIEATGVIRLTRKSGCAGQA